MKTSSKAHLLMVGMIIAMFAIFATNHVMADSTSTTTVPTDAQSLISEGITAAIAAGTPTFGIGLLLAGIRFMGKKINDANSTDPNAMTPFQIHMFLITGLVGFVAGAIMSALHLSADLQSGAAVILTYFITQLAPAFKNLSWTGKSTKIVGDAKK